MVESLPTGGFFLWCHDTCSELSIEVRCFFIFIYRSFDLIHILYLTLRTVIKIDHRYDMLSDLRLSLRLFCFKLIDQLIGQVKAHSIF